MIVLLGAPRTASMSMFIVLSKHKDICVSHFKEPWNRVSKERKLLWTLNDSYLDEFKCSDKIMVDGTPCVYHYNKKYLDKMKNLYKFKIIYPIRNPYERMYSTIKQTIFTHAHFPYKGQDTEYPKFIKGIFDVDFDKLLEFIPTLFDSVNLEYAYDVTDDVLLIDFDDMISDMSPVYEFLGIEKMKVDFPISNLIHWSPEQDNIREKLDYFFVNNSEFHRMVEADKHKMKEKYGI